jgi:hypothetical protein
MQATAHTRRYFGGRRATGLVAVGIVVATIAVAAAAGITAGLRDDDAARVASTRMTSAAVATAAQRQLAMERADFWAWHQSQIPFARATTDPQEARQRQLDMERSDFWFWQEMMRVPALPATPER